MPGIASPPVPGRRRIAGELRRRLESALLAATLALLAAGGGAWVAGARGWADLLWGSATVVALVPAVAWVVAAVRRRQLGADVIAVLALAGTLAVGSTWPVR